MMYHTVFGRQICHVGLVLVDFYPRIECTVAVLMKRSVLNVSSAQQHKVNGLLTLMNELSRVPNIEARKLCLSNELYTVTNID